MKIITEISNKLPEVNKKVFLNNILKRVVTILKNDPRFSIREKVEKLNKIDRALRKKEKAFLSLLESSDSLKETVNKDIKSLDTLNENLRIKIIKQLTKG